MVFSASQKFLPVSPLEVSVESLPEHTSWSIELPARFESLERVREFVAQVALAFGLNPSDVYSVQLATDEAFSNIIEHAYGGVC